MNKPLKLLTAWLTLVIVGLPAHGLTEAERDAIVERIKPVGEVCLQGDETCGIVAPPVSVATRSGEQVYNSICVACHLTGVANAPMLGDTAAWAERIAKGIDALYETSITGMAGTTMLPMGSCMDCSNEEVTAAVDFMVENSR
ncbi:MAG: c-type cytochrome [Halieaceae bacterium]|nr:c-type cytochrome [Halieaceae bacterium]